MIVFLFRLRIVLSQLARWIKILLMNISVLSLLLNLLTNLNLIYLWTVGVSFITVIRLLNLLLLALRKFSQVIDSYSFCYSCLCWTQKTFFWVFLLQTIHNKFCCSAINLMLWWTYALQLDSICKRFWIKFTVSWKIFKFLLILLICSRLPTTGSCCVPYLIWTSS